MAKMPDCPKSLPLKGLWNSLGKTNLLCPLATAAFIGVLLCPYVTGCLRRHCGRTRWKSCGRCRKRTVRPLPAPAPGLGGPFLPTSNANSQQSTEAPMDGPTV